MRTFGQCCNTPRQGKMPSLIRKGALADETQPESFSRRHCRRQCRRLLVYRQQTTAARRAIDLAHLQAPVSVRYDERGVPHIQAQNEADMYRASVTCMPRTACSRWK